MAPDNVPAPEVSAAPVEGVASADAAAAAPEAAVAAPEAVVAESAPVEAPAAEPAESPEAAAEGVETAKEGEAEAKPEGAEEAKPEAEAEAKAKAEEPIKYEPFKVPEGMVADEAQLSAYGNILGKYGLPQEAGQELMDFGGQVIKQAQEKMAADQVDAFNETRRGWVKDFETKAGNRRNTILNDARSAIKDLVPDDKARADLWSALAYTGAGDHPALINAFAALGKRLRENGPSPKGLPTTQNLSPAERRYGGSK